MPRKYPQIALILVAAACRESASAAPPKPRVIALGDALTLTVTAERCAVTGEAEVEVTRQGADTIASMGPATTLTLGAGRTGTEILDAEGTTRLRVIDQAGQLSLVSKEGVPVARVFASATQASVVDAARAPVLTVTRDGDHLAVTAADDSAPPTTVTGTDDLTLAAVLALPGVPPDVRALIACARALPAPAPVASDSP